MRKLLLILFLILAGLNVHSQTTVLTEGRARDKAYYRAQSIVPIFLLTSDTIEENNAFGVEDKIKNNTRIIAIPEDLKDQKKLGYGYLYFGAAENAFATGYILFLISNNTRNNKPSILYIDRNNDFDLTNDGAPDSINYTDDHLDIHLFNTKANNAKYIVRLSRFDYNKQYKYINLTDVHYNKHSGNKTYMGTFYSFREQRLNVLAGNYKSATDSFTIALKDNNCNGLFNDVGLDEVFIGNYQSEQFADIAFKVGKNNEALIETTGKVFKLTSIAPNGSLFTVTQVFDEPFQHQLNIGKKVPKIKFQLADTGKIRKKKICKFRRKPTFVYFLNSKVETLQEDTLYLRKIYNEFGKKINVVMLNSGDIPREAKKMAILGNLPYTCGISNLEIDEKWYVKRKPVGFFMQKRLKLQYSGISPKELYVLLENGGK